MSFPPNPNKKVECPVCEKKFKRVCDMSQHHGNAHPDAKIVFVPEGEPSKSSSKYLGNLKEYPGRTAIIKSNSNGKAVITVMMGPEHVGARPRDPNVEKPKVTFFKKKHRCPLRCKKSGMFASPSDVRRHLREKHPDYDGPVPVARVHPPQPNQCNHCEMSYSKRSKLNRHLLQVHGIDTKAGEDVTMSDEDSPPAAATASSHTAGSAPSYFSRSQPRPSGAPVPLSSLSARPVPSLPPSTYGDMARQAEDGARKLEELYARVVETQRNLTFMQQQAQMGIPPSRPGSMMGNMPGNMPGNLPGNLPGNMPVNMGGDMPGPSYGMGGAFSGIPQGRPYGMGTQMGMNMGMQYGSLPQQSPGDWQGQGQGKNYPQQQQQYENVYIRRQ